jgi:BASS family bile acid:Na+ symporter
MDLLLGTLVASIRVMLFALGLRTTADDVLYLWRRQGLLFRSLLAMYVVVPIAALVMALALDLPPVTRRALVVLGISAGAPLVPRRLLGAGGDPPYVMSLAVTSALVAIVSVPASLALFSTIFGVRVEVTPASLAWLVGRSFLLPFLGGVALRRLWPAVAVYIEPLTRAAALVFTVSAVLFVAAVLPLAVDSGWRSFAALALLTLSALAAGHLMGGPKLEDRAALAVLCATRHIGMVMLIASAGASRAAAAAISAYLVVALLVSTPYLLWIQRRRRRV